MNPPKKVLVDAKAVWDECLSIIKDNINPLSFKTWFEPIVPLKVEGKQLTIQVPSQFFYEWLEEHYYGLIKKTLTKVLGEGAKLVLFRRDGKFING
jgi:chromosomal replication initiator protein